MSLGTKRTVEGDITASPRIVPLGVAHDARTSTGTPAPERTGHEQALDAAADFAVANSGLGIAAFAADLMALSVAAIGAAALESLHHQAQGAVARSLAFTATFARLFVTTPVLAVLLAGTSRKHVPFRTTVWNQLASIVTPLAVGGLLVLSGWRLAGGAGLVMPPAPDALLLLCALSVLTVPMVRHAHSSSPIGERKRARRVVIVGSGVVAERVADRYASDSGVVVLGFVDDDPMDGTRWIGHLSTLAEVCDRQAVDHVVVAFSRSTNEELVAALRPVQGRVPITVVPRLFDVLPATASIHEFASGMAGISIAPATLGWGPRAVKRAIDVAAAGGALLLASPLLAVIALAIRLTSRGPALFHQERIGESGRSFQIVKFRSMYIAADRRHPSMVNGTATVGPFPKLKDDPRITPVGRFIRKTSLDELPQLWNVLRGEMSLVGPRPFTTDDSSWIDGWARCRYRVRPGITGLWQVSGRNDLTFDEMCRLDSIYVSCWSVGLDIRILLRTLRVIFTRDGAY